MTIILSTDHVVDSEADVITFETSTQLRNHTGRVNGYIKEMYYGWYQNAINEGYVHNLKVGSILVQKSAEIPPDRTKPLVVAGMVLNSPSLHRPRPVDVRACNINVFSWFWNQDEYKSIGSIVLGIRDGTRNAMQGTIKGFVTAWEQGAGAAGRSQREVEERTLIIHCAEGLFLSPIRHQPWVGKFDYVKLWNPLSTHLKH